MLRCTLVWTRRCHIRVDAWRRATYVRLTFGVGRRGPVASPAHTNTCSVSLAGLGPRRAIHENW